MSKILWVTWEEQRRNKEIANAINAEFHEIIVKGGRVKRYLKSLWKTFILYRKTPKPFSVVCQNPSIVLATFSVLASKIFGFKIGIDTHNGGLALYKMDAKYRWMKWVAKFLQKYADFIIITNEPLRSIVESNKGKAVVLPDKIPVIQKVEPIKLQHKYNIFFICSYAVDEPYEEVFKAAAHLDKDVGIYVSGKYEGKIDSSKYPTNVHFMGRVPWDVFDTMLYSVDGTIDLTTREYCLVCGAYETVSAEKPLILSDTVALKTYFNKGAVYTSNDQYSISKAIGELIENKDRLDIEVKALKLELQQDWEQRKQELVSIL